MCQAGASRRGARFWTEAPAGIAEELLSALQEEEAEEECFVWPLALEDRTDETETVPLDPFLKGSFRT